MALKTIEATTGVDSKIHKQIAEERRAALPDPARVTIYRDYARGAHKQTFTRKQMQHLRGLRLLIIQNVIKRILVVLANRIHVTGYSVADDGVNAFLRDVWVRNWLSALYAQIVYTTLRDGNAGATIGFDNARQRPVITREKWFNGSTGIWFAYDDRGEPTYAVKDWISSEGQRRTVYYDNEIRRYILDTKGASARGATWRWYTDDETPDAGPIAWVDANGDALGMAAVHFAVITEPADSEEDCYDNQSDGNYGVSKCEGGLIGLQDSVNELIRLLLVASRFTAFQIPTASGLKPETDKRTGDPIPPQVSPGAMLTSEDPAARFGYIPAGSIDQLLKSKSDLIESMADVAGVPKHAIKGNWPSGEALMRAEMEIIDQARKAAASLGPSFASLAHKSVILSNRFGNTALNERALITTLFEPPERYDPATLTELANKRGPFVSLAEVWRLYGYDRERQKQIENEMKAEASFRPVSANGLNPDDGAIDAEANLFPPDLAAADATADDSA